MSASQRPVRRDARGRKCRRQRGSNGRRTRACVRLWRGRDYARRRDAIAAIARPAGYSVAMLENSIDALLKPFTSEALKSMAARVSGNSRIDRPKTVGFIAAGNVAGAGIHEIAIALIAGVRVVIKTASAEPIFFAEFARTLAEIDPDAGRAHRGSLLEPRTYRPDRALIAKCERVVAYGDDATIESLRNRRNVIGFGSRVSAAVSRRAIRRESKVSLSRSRAMSCCSSNSAACRSIRCSS